MKVLYATQSTGNGHLIRAIEMIPHLSKMMDVDVLVSGYQGDIKLPFPIKYKFHGLSYIFGRKGNIDRLKTLVKFRPFGLIRDIHQFPIKKYDFVINDFEPISAWAAKRNGVKCLGMSHQAAFLSRKSPRPEHTDVMGEKVLKYFAPVDNYVGLHYRRYDNRIETPLVRRAIRRLVPSERQYILVYLPAYDDEALIRFFDKIWDTEFRIFSKRAKISYRRKNVFIYPVGSKYWLQCFSESYGVIMGAGFEGPSEALYLGKRLMVTPMRGQYEQHCNLAALKKIGISFFKTLNDDAVIKIKKWLNHEPIKLDCIDNGELIAQRLLNMPR